MPKEHWVQQLGADWYAAYGGSVPFKQIGAHCKVLVQQYPFSQVQIHFQHYLAAHKNGRAVYASPARFAQTFAEWAGPTQSVVRVPYVSKYPTADEADAKAGIPLEKP